MPPGGRRSNRAEAKRRLVPEVRPGWEVRLPDRDGWDRVVGVTARVDLTGARDHRHILTLADDTTVTLADVARVMSRRPPPDK